MATSIKEAKRMAKAEKKRFKHERKASKKQRKLERKMRKIQRKGAKLERKLGKPVGAAPPGAEAEFEKVAETKEEVPEFEVIAAEAEPVKAEREVPEMPVDKGRIPEIERKMDYMLEGESGVVRRFKEKYGEELDMPVAPQARKGAPERAAEPTAPPKEAVKEGPPPGAGPVKAEPVEKAAPTEKPAKEKKKKEKKAAAPGEPVPFLDFKRWKFVQSRMPPSNIVMTVVLSVVDLILWIVRLIIGIPVMVLKKILGLLKRKPKADTARE